MEVKQFKTIINVCIDAAKKPLASAVYWKRLSIALILPASMLLGTGRLYADTSAPRDLTLLSIEELMNVEVISTSKQAQRLSDAAAAVFVITQEDIRRSGVTSIPEALRMVPGMQVARIDSNKWAVTARGFNGRFANKLLVLIDGRSVYTPTFSGVYWEIQDLLLEDIERIEVIRGPGASLWGANAVNGIINIITKHTADTQGTLVSLTAGNEEEAIVGLRHGGKLGDHGYFRIFGKYLERDALVDLNENDAGDDWELKRTGFRLDWASSLQNTFSIQADFYDGDLDQNFQAPALTKLPTFSRRIQDTVEVSGYHLQGQWQHILSPTSETKLQIYYQRDERKELLVNEERDTFDIDFQHAFALAERQEIVWGLGYRLTYDDFADTLLTTLSPSSREDHLFSAFIQDQITLLDELELTVGSKLEYNDYTGWEFQPSARLLWAPQPNQRLWTAVSRAVRSPSRGERDVRIDASVVPPQPPQLPVPGLITLNGSSDFNSETLIAYEVGYRTWPRDDLSLDIAAFYHDYDDLRAAELQGMPALVMSPQGPHLLIPAVFTNGSQGNTYGVELAANWHPADWWRLDLAYTYLRAELDDLTVIPAETVVPIAAVSNESVPRHQVSLRSSFDIRHNVELDLWWRYLDELPQVNSPSPDGRIGIDDYLTLDARLGWLPGRDIELSLVGRNLIDVPRLEFINELLPFPTQVERSIYGQIKWSF